MDHSAQVLVLGAGPRPGDFGAALDEQSDAASSTKSSRSRRSRGRSRIQARTLEIVQIADLNVGAFLQRGHTVQHGSIFDQGGDLLAQIDFDRLQTKYRFMLLLPQNETEEIFEKRLNGYEVKVERGTELVACEAGPFRRTGAAPTE